MTLYIFEMYIGLIVEFVAHAIGVETEELVKFIEEKTFAKTSIKQQ